MALLDLLGRRWSLRVVWELRDGTSTFRELQEACGGISSSVLATRLRELRDADVIVVADGGYRLSREGHELLKAYAPLDAWARRWAARTARRR